MDLNIIAQQSHGIAIRRGQQTDCYSCIKHCAGEIVEVAEAYGWYIELPGDENKKELESEVADVIMCMLTLSAELGFDVEQILNDCLEKNRKRVCVTANVKAEMKAER